MRIPPFFAAILLAFAALLPSPALADVNVTFYTREFGEKFPHAFFLAKGTTNGKTVDDNYGFTATSVSPAILFGSVEGDVVAVNDKYVAKSDAHFTLRLNDTEFAKLMGVVKKWKAIPQKSYNLNKRNCVHFIADALNVLGYKTDPKMKYKKKPTSFMKQTMKLNPELGN